MEASRQSDQVPPRGLVLRTIIASLAIAAAVVALVSLPAQYRAPVLVFAAIALWSTALLPEHVVALAFFLAALLAGVAPPEVVFSGFHSQALWLIFAGLIVGVAVSRSGLADRLAGTLVTRSGASYAGAISTVVMAGLALTFILPSSMGRTVMLLPIAIAFAERLGYAAGSRGRNGIALAAVLGAYLPSAGVLPANFPNVVLAASAAQLYGIQINYASYLLLNFPVMGLLKAILIIALVTLFHRQAPRDGAFAAPAARRPWTPAERSVTVVLAISLAMWMTDFWHGIAPAWVALAAAVVCILPAIRLVPAKSFNQDISYVAIFHAAGIIGLGSVVAYSGVGDDIGRRLVAIAPFIEGEAMWNFWLLCLIATVTCLLTTTPGVPAVLTPLAEVLAAASGLPLEAVLMSQTVGFATLLFPYQGAPLVFALHYAGVGTGTAIRLLLALAAVTLVALIPLTYLWWRLLGYVGGN